jgi:hypothetical protein
MTLAGAGFVRRLWGRTTENGLHVYPLIDHESVDGGDTRCLRLSSGGVVLVVG